MGKWERKTVHDPTGDVMHVHCYPLDDLLGHQTGEIADCWCDPWRNPLTEVVNGVPVLAHHSFDGRENERGPDRADT